MWALREGKCGKNSAPANFGKWFDSARLWGLVHLIDNDGRGADGVYDYWVVGELWEGTIAIRGADG